MTQAEKEIERLAEFLAQHFPRELGMGNHVHGESAVDVAIRLLSPETKEERGTEIPKAFNPSLRKPGET